MECANFYGTFFPKFPSILTTPTHQMRSVGVLVEGVVVGQLLAAVLALDHLRLQRAVVRMLLVAAQDFFVRIVITADRTLDPVGGCQLLLMKRF
jgi:hypothetical protein